MKLLLHSCCGPCSTYPIKVLKEDKIEITSMWFNTNIHPYMEYKNRYESYKLLMEKENIPTIEMDEYDIITFTRAVYGHELERCRYCYESRMEVVAKTAKERGFDAFTTSLLVSPYQKHELLKEVCEKMAEKYGVTFYYRDFREGFREGQQMAREMGLYMQKYCGCVYSEAERYKKLK
ncbi:MAG: epoxyqueuosine reductase QueH [Clostridia bacterium]|nr:epoxyqueuosine reductase QueH [Clostridia bacterium]